LLINLLNITNQHLLHSESHGQKLLLGEHCMTTQESIDLYSFC